LYGEGISREGDVLDLADEVGIVEKSGAWYSYGSDRIGQGRENAKSCLKDNPAMCDNIEGKVLENYGLPPRRHLQLLKKTGTDDAPVAEESDETKAKAGKKK